MKKIKRFTRLVLCILLVSSTILSGCGSPKAEKAEIKAIRDISSAAGFLASKVEKSDGFIAADLDGGEDFAYLYDNALAAFVLSRVGAKEYAEKIADAMLFAQSHDRSFKDGRLRNAYTAGNPKSDSGRSLVAGSVTVSLPGFWSDGRWQEDVYTDSTSTGNMAWTIISLCEVASKAEGDKRDSYIEAAMKAADFVLTLQSPDGCGFTAGYDGWDDTQNKATYLSTEHNVDLITAFRVMAELTEDSEKASRYLAASESAKSFVYSMYDEDKGCVYAGTENDGYTVSKGIIPLDTNSLPVLALGSSFEGRFSTISLVEDTMSVGRGFDFSAGDLDGIWNEGTAQMALCYMVLGMDNEFNSVSNYLRTQVFSDGSIPAADRDGVSTGFAISGTNTLWEYNNDQSIAATCWYAFVQLKINPLA